MVSGMRIVLLLVAFIGFLPKLAVAFIEHGKTINLEGATKLLPIEEVAIGPYDLGFDQKAFKSEHTIKNIDITSNAYKAGLRNGDKIIGYNFPKGQDPDQIAEINTPSKDFKFRPEHAKKTKAYQLKPNLSAKDKLQIRRFF